MAKSIFRYQAGLIVRFHAFLNARVLLSARDKHEVVMWFICFAIHTQFQGH